MNIRLEIAKRLAPIKFEVVNIEVNLKPPEIVDAG